MPSLTERVQDLSADIFNRIKEFTFTIDEDEIEITEDYKPPVQLHVDRASREHALSTIKFLVNGRYEEAGVKWLKSLGTNEANIPKSIHFEVENHLWNRPDGYRYTLGVLRKKLPLKDRVVEFWLIPKQDRARLYWASAGTGLRRVLVPPKAQYKPSRVICAHSAGVKMANWRDL